MQLHSIKKIAAALLLAGSVTVQATPADIPEHKTAVTDLTGTLSQDVLTILNKRADELKTHTSVEMAILLTPSLNGEDLDAYAGRVAQTWHLGDSNKKSVLLVVSFTEHGIRLVSTRNLADHLDDSRATDIISGTLAPEFKQGHLPKGLAKAMAAIESDLTGPALLFSQGRMMADANARATPATGASSPASPSTNMMPASGGGVWKVFLDDTLALGLVGFAIVSMLILMTASRIRSDRALRRKVLRAHVERSAVQSSRVGTTASRSALDKAVVANREAFTGTLAKSRLSGLRDNRTPHRDSSGEQDVSGN